MVNKENVSKIATLARLEIPEAELEKFTQQMNQILDFMERLNGLKIEAVEPTSHAVSLQNNLREDQAQKSSIQAEVFKAAPASEANLFRVPKVIA